MPMPSKTHPSTRDFTCSFRPRFLRLLDHFLLNLLDFHLTVVN